MEDEDSTGLPTTVEAILWVLFFLLALVILYFFVFKRVGI